MIHRSGINDLCPYTPSLSTSASFLHGVFPPFRPHQDNKKPWEWWGLRDKCKHCWTSFFSPRARFSRSVMSVSLLPLSPCPLLNATCRRRCFSFYRRCFWFPAWIMGRWEQRRRAAASPPPRPGTMASPQRSETRQSPTRPPRGDFAALPPWQQVNINKKNKQNRLCFSQSLLLKMEMSCNRGNSCDS